MNTDELLLSAVKEWWISKKNVEAFKDNPKREEAYKNWEPVAIKSKERLIELLKMIDNLDEWNNNWPSC